MAVEYLARNKALAAPEIQADDELKATGTKELAVAKEQLEKAIKRAYQHVAFLAQPDPDGERHLDELTFDDEHSTSLDGTIVWKALAERSKVFDAGAFTAKALVHNLRDTDYGRSLSDLRAAFYSAPRLPLLYAGDRDLQQAIYDAANAGLVDIVDGLGESVAVTAPNEVNLASAGLRLAKPKPATTDTPAPTSGADAVDGGTGTPAAPMGGTAAGTDARAPEPATEQQVSFSFTKNLLSDHGSADQLADLFKALYQALDERQVSYGQGTLQLVVAAGVAEALAARLQALGISVTIKSV
jgi:hypothetical protein